MSRESGAWAGLLAGTAMTVAPLAPSLPSPPTGVGTVPAGAEVATSGAAAPALWTGLVTARLPTGAPRLPAPPVRLVAAAIGVDAPVTASEVEPDRALEVPADPAVVGWWRAGAQPGSAAGSVVLAGHVDTRADGPGALFRLAALRPGDRVVVGTATGRVAYVVEAVHRYPKAGLPAEVFATTGPPRLVLITCGGDFDPRTRHYAENVVVYAIPIATEPPS